MKRRNKKPIIIADDDPAILRLVKTIVEKEGYEVSKQPEMEKRLINFCNPGTIFAAAVFDVVMPYIQGTELRSLYAIGKTFDEYSGNNDDC